MRARHIGRHGTTVLKDHEWADMIETGGYRGLIFDCDGTLVLSEDAHFAAFSEAVARQGRTLNRGWYDARTGLDRTGLLTACAEQVLPGLDIGQATSDSIAAYIAQDAPLPKVEEVVTLAHRFRKLARIVATNAEGAVAAASLTRAGIIDLFDAVVAVDDVDAPKPAPSMFLKAAQIAGLQSQDMLVIEDSPQGASAAERAGMDVLLLDHAD
ncbi:HAD family hydrolase [Pontivivens insulae]|uniref:Fructose-1-phosphate phosphatase YqaB n=1 Tax=Pontivivens insulae TaxID=1639689 RepID=A0A2R8A6P3_9RHOB|nr:HAD family phosphatase [Pontivivens insulae]RED18010.1 HAD superfamily hydrolase (TIGR01509 family) [Pontivivens insulae]SPF27903.1 Fructose-1-phosphate phosphatase YqaB [Pontivivens insulae]